MAKLEDKITFNKIYEVIYRTFDAIPLSDNIDIDAIYERLISSHPYYNGKIHARLD